jgi:hypothetical protein
MNLKMMITGSRYYGTTGPRMTFGNSSKPFGAKLEKGAGSNPAAPANFYTYQSL